MDLGYNDGNLEYREWPWPIRLIFLAALLVTAWNLVATVARRTTDDIYLSNWYTMGGVLWTCIIAVVAILPWYQYGLGQVAVSGYYMHNAVGMWFTPLALGIFYYALPKLLSRPIYSYALGVLRAARPGFQETEIAGLPALVSDQEALILAHPLWFTEPGRRGPELLAAFDEATQGRGLSVGDESFISVFNALRRPI